MSVNETLGTHGDYLNQAQLARESIVNDPATMVFSGGNDQPYKSELIGNTRYAQWGRTNITMLDNSNAK